MKNINSLIYNQFNYKGRYENSSMLPTYQRLDGPPPIFSITFVKIAFGCLSLPLGAFIFCVVWSLIFEFERSTYTHCDVANFLPSVSAAIGNYEPQKTVWRLAIILHMPLRLATAKMYLQYYRDNIRRNRRFFANIAIVLNVVENFALLSLSIWTSSDSYEIHRNAFCTFVACSEIYMFLSYILNKNGRKAPLIATEEKSLKMKRNLFLINVLAFSLAGYCFVRHNRYCEPLVYTFFALFEYIVVLTNMSFHMTACWDFYGLNVTFDYLRGLQLTQF